MSSQALVLCVTCVSGFIMGFILEAYRLLVGRTRWRRRKLSLMDFLLWVVLTACMFGLLYYLNGAEVHFYVFLGLALGLLSYIRWCRRYACAFLRAVWHRLKKA